MIINKKTYQSLINGIINQFDYVLIRFHITDNKISSELIVLQDIKPYLYHLKKHLYIPIFDTNIYHKSSEDYIKHLQIIKNDKLSYIDNVEFSNIISMLKKEYPIFIDFIINAENIEAEITIIKKTADAIKIKLNNIQKKLNKLTDYSFTKANPKELEKFKINKFQEYLDNYLNPIQTDIEINEDLLDLTEQLSELKDKLEKLNKVREFAPVDFEIGKLKTDIKEVKKKIVLLKQQEFNNNTIPSAKPKKITSIQQREDLKQEFLNSAEFQLDLEIEKNSLIKNNIWLYLEKESLQNLIHLFIDDTNHLISSNKNFEEKKPLLVEEAYKKLYPIYKNDYNKTGKLPPKLKTYSQNIYAKFQREILTINLYTLEHTYNMNEEVKQALTNVYNKSDRQFNNLASNEDTCMNIIDLEAIEDEIKYNESKDYSIKTNFSNHLSSLGIEGSDWQEKAKDLDIEIPYENILGKEVEYLEDIASEIQIFQDDITMQEFNYFLENNSLNKFNTNKRTNTINTDKINQPYKEEPPF